MKTKITGVLTLFLTLAITDIVEAVNVPPGAAVCVKEVSFYESGTSQNYHELVSDDWNIAYSAPQWVKDEHNYSVAYTRNTVAEVSAKLQFPPECAGIVVKIWAEGSENIDLSPAIVSVGSDGIATYPRSPATELWPNEVKFYDRSTPDFQFEWKVKILNTGQEGVAGKTDHQVYITLEDPTTFRREETLFYLACNDNTEGHAGAGHNLTKDIFLKFNSKNIHPINPDSGNENPGITLKFFPGKGSLLVNYEAVCDEWAEFFVDVLKVHGMSGMTHAVDSTTIPAPGGIFWAGKLWFVEDQKLNAAGTDFFDDGFLNGHRNKGQGNMHPIRSWLGHRISSAYGHYYDPSYAIGPCATALQYETEAVAGYGYAGLDSTGRARQKAWDNPKTGAVLKYTPPK